MKENDENEAVELVAAEIAAVLAARQALDATPTEAEIAEWMRTL